MRERRTFAIGMPDYHEVDLQGGAPAADAGDENEFGDLGTDPLLLNMGPSHPATHGVVHLLITVEGETVIGAQVELGYLHRGFEKECEAATWTQVFPYTDRLNYASPMLNNVAYAHSVEKLLGVSDQVPLRAQYLRVITGEMSRITDHLTCNGSSAMELGAFTVFLWMMKARDILYGLLEELSGARLTYSWCRVGGVVNDTPPGWADKLAVRLPEVRRCLDDSRRLLVDNRIFRDRMENVGVISQARALAHGFTGPQLRSTGIALDVRKDHPYLVYDRFDFTVPVGSRGDCLDRFLVRMEEMTQSLSIVEQALAQLPLTDGGALVIDDPRIALPPRPGVHDTIEGMIRHFKLILDGIRVPPGECYGYTEAANGELGFYLVSDGMGRPWKCRCRGPSFVMAQALPEMIVGGQLADVVPVFGMQNYIAGEAER